MRVPSINYATRDYNCIKGLMVEGRREYRMLGTVTKARELSTQLGISYTSYKNRSGQQCFKFKW